MDPKQNSPYPIKEELPIYPYSVKEEEELAIAISPTPSKEELKNILESAQTKVRELTNQLAKH